MASKESTIRKTENKIHENVPVEIQKLKTERDLFAQRLKRVGNALLNRMKKDWKLEMGIPNDIDVLDLRGQVLVEAVKELTHKKFDEKGFTTESKVVCLEKQVSELNKQLGTFRKKCRIYEEGLESVLLREDITYAKDKVLSIQSVAGSDWRQLAKQVGITCEIINEWKAMELENPAGQVLTHWIMTDSGATVQQFHAHLNSPAMRRSVLCKILSEYYEIM